MTIQGTGPLRSAIGKRELLLSRYASLSDHTLVTTEKAVTRTYAAYDLDRFLLFLIGLGFLGVTLALWLGGVFTSFYSKGYWAVGGYAILITLFIWDFLSFRKARKAYQSARTASDINQRELSEINRDLAECEAMIAPLITDVVASNDVRYTREGLENDVFKGETVQDRIVWYDLWAREFLGEEVTSETDQERRVRAVRKNL